MELKHCRTGIKSDATFITFRDIDVHHMGIPHCANPEPTGGCHGLYVSGDDNTFDNIRSHDNTGHGGQIYFPEGEGVAERHTIKNSVFYNNNGHGLLTNRNNTIYNNIAYNNYTGFFIDTDCRFWNNIAYNNVNVPTGGGGLARLGIMVGSNTESRNNISLGHADGDTWGPTPTTATTNVCGSTSLPGCTHVMSAAAIFVNAAGADFHHKETSPARNMGPPSPRSPWILTGILASSRMTSARMSSPPLGR